MVDVEIKDLIVVLCYLISDLQSGIGFCCNLVRKLFCDSQCSLSFFLSHNINDCMYDARDDAVSYFTLTVDLPKC